MVARFSDSDERYGIEGAEQFPISNDPDVVQQIVDAQRTDLNEVVNMPQFAATQNNLSLPVGKFFRMSTDGVARAITGLAGVSPGRLVFLSNVAGGANIPLNNQDAGSTAQFRIITGTGAAVNIQPDRTAILWYDPNTTRWRLAAFT